MYTNYHLTISKEDYLKIHYPKSANLTILKIAPDLRTFHSLLSKVGSSWGWGRRPKYYEDEKALKERLYDKSSKLFLLKCFNEITGYCFTIKRADLTTRFNKNAVAEIENFGLFPERTGKGYGRTFLPLIFEQLFENNDLVYLSSRDTNHPRVIPFYESLGMSVIHTEKLQDDLRPDPPKWNFDI